MAIQESIKRRVVNCLRTSKAEDKHFFDDMKRQFTLDRQYLSTLVFKKGGYCLDLIQMNQLEETYVYYDRFPLLRLRKLVLFGKGALTLFCQMIANSRWFDNLVLIVILYNTVL